MPPEAPAILPSGRDGGAIPGAVGKAAFTLFAREPSSIPVLLSVPHAGQVYPASLTDALRAPRQAAMRLEDRLADRLGHAVAAATGAHLLVAHAPRAMIDLNRAPEEIDWDMVPANERPSGDRPSPNRRTRGGLGLVPRRVSGLGELWKRPLRAREIEARIAQVHVPYHEVLAASLAGLRGRWGAALLVDLHSMPPIAPAGTSEAAEIVIGDRFGSTCEGSLTAVAFAVLARRAITAAHNRPYAGGYTLERHSDRPAGMHAMQLEIDRSAYLDDRLRETGTGFDRTVETLVALIRQLGAETASLGRAGRSGAWPEAAQ